MEKVSNNRNHFFEISNFDVFVKWVLGLSLIELVLLMTNTPIYLIYLLVPIIFIGARGLKSKEACNFSSNKFHLLLSFAVVLGQFFLPKMILTIVDGIYFLVYAILCLNLIIKSTVDNSQSIRVNFIGVYALFFLIGTIIELFAILKHFIGFSFIDRVEFFNISLTALVVIFCIVTLTMGDEGNTQLVKITLDEVSEDLVTNKVEIKSATCKVEMINTFFLNNKEYLDNAFTIEDLADAISVSRHEVSEIINHQMNTSFYQLLAKYRIDYAKGLLLERQNLTIEAIVGECGFSSKSTFNKYFKMFVGKTPSVYRNIVA
ncbi:helix-turn-helix domain-containing protein [Myroides injenensis]|uniref:helix-turn-helix domain-containing protein n=1 Tax=Myroides injenensis TaxID=1183151 RepID=UPI00028A1B6B|nr:helix-turn-helix domain-containing protein [Myroides injenensis]